MITSGIKKHNIAICVSIVIIDKIIKKISILNRFHRFKRLNPFSSTCLAINLLIAKDASMFNEVRARSSMDKAYDYGS